MPNQYTKLKMQQLAERKEIKWNIINSLLSGALVFLGSLADLKFEWIGVGAAFIVAVIVAITKFKDYWDGEKKEYSSKLFKFL